jgi:outer membrane protein assembly factor BamB
MAGANPARTSAASEGPGGMLSARWIKPIEPYISQKVQLVASGGMIFVATARGLYALDAASGAERWVYATELPLGHSPTVADGIVYVGGFDRQLHALQASTGTLLWTFRGGAGFQTNPLVVDGIVYAGNRDGYLYAVAAGDGSLVWRFQAGGPILFSAAYADGVVYFAANDGYAYALDAAGGSLRWRSEKLPGMGFHSYWPVVYGDYLIVPGSAAFDGNMHPTERDDIFPNWESDPDGTLVGPLGSERGNWAPGTPTIDASKPNETGSSTPIIDYFAAKPWRRTLFVLDRQTGREVTFDFGANGQAGYIPALWSGTTGSGNRYPPVAGPDGVLYLRNNYMSDGAIAGGGITGWQPGTPFLSLPQSREMGGNGDWPVDEPSAYSIGGDYLYYNLCCDRVVGAVDLSQPNPAPPPDRISARAENSRQWRYGPWQLPGYNSQLQRFLWFPEQSEADGVLYYAHGDQNAPVPYNGMVYVHRSNAVIAFAPDGGGELLPPATIAEPAAGAAVRPVEALAALLAGEIEKIIATGHLRPGYSSLGLHNHLLRQIEPHVLDYFANPADTLTVLLRALPYLPPDLQVETRDYIQAEFAQYPPQRTAHSGWLEGAPRGPFDLPELARGEWAGRQGGMPPQNVYALWKYAEAFGGAQELFDEVHGRQSSAPPDDELAWNPQRHNALIAGYLGYLELEKLAGQPESAEVRNELERLLALRAGTFTAELRHPEPRSPAAKYYYTLLISWNFMNMTPELASYLHEHAQEKVSAAVAVYERVAPYWFVAQAEEVQGEGVLAPLHHYHGLFQAKAQILREPYEALEPYLDVPAFTTGDLFYIDNLVAAIESGADTVLLPVNESPAATLPSPAPDTASDLAAPATTTNPAVSAATPNRVVATETARPGATPDAEPSYVLWGGGILLAMATATAIWSLARIRRHSSQ